MRRQVRTARGRFLWAATLGVVGAVVSGLVGWWRFAPIVGWECAAAVFIVWVWIRVWRLDATGTQELARREDPTRAATDLLMLTASVASLGAVGVVVYESSRATTGLAKGALAGLAIASVAVSWALVHTLFTLRYARLYYSGEPGGIDFNESDPPRYSDFAYLSFTIGMTFQVSDTNLTDKVIRATALRQELLSYLFGAIILASTINLIDGLGG